MNEGGVEIGVARALVYQTVQERQSLRNPDLDVPRDANKLQTS